MYSQLKKEVDAYEKRTPKSREAHERASKRVPLGVGSNYRFYPPYPLFVRDAGGVRLHDLDGNEYIDHNLCYGALISGHCHPALSSTRRSTHSYLRISPPSAKRMGVNSL